MESPNGYWIAFRGDIWQTFHWTSDRWPTTDETGYIAIGGPCENRKDAEDRVASLNNFR